MRLYSLPKMSFPDALCILARLYCEQLVGGVLGFSVGAVEIEAVAGRPSGRMDLPRTVEDCSGTRCQSCLRAVTSEEALEGEF